MLSVFTNFILLSFVTYDWSLLSIYKHSTISHTNFRTLSQSFTIHFNTFRTHSNTFTTHFFLWQSHSYLAYILSYFSCCGNFFPEEVSQCVTQIICTSSSLGWPQINPQTSLTYVHSVLFTKMLKVPVFV
jgi:hypothetical protein